MERKVAIEVHEHPVRWRFSSVRHLLGRAGVTGMRLPLGLVLENRPDHPKRAGQPHPPRPCGGRGVAGLPRRDTGPTLGGGS